MWQTSKNDERRDITTANAAEVIAESKRLLGKRCLILGHPDADKTLLKYCDRVSDEAALPEAMRQANEARFLVVCAPRALAESADMLSTRDRLVLLPQDPGKKTELIPADQVLRAWSQIVQSGFHSVTPVADYHVSPNVKAFIGNHMGVVCPSANAPEAIKWGLARSRQVLFIGDREVGRAAAKQLGIDVTTGCAAWRPGVSLGGNTVEELKARRLWLWDVTYPVEVTKGALDEVRLASIVDMLARGKTPREVVSIPRATAHAAVKGIRRLGSMK
jgi:quinolinate synthase